jgi:tetratricopeptide (TPR) repeat protein
VVWLNADTSGVDQINIEFLRLARALGIDTKPLDQAGIVHCVYQALVQQPKVLVVFDSATKYEDIYKYCPPENTSIRLLVTTRDDQRWVAQFAQLPLGIFSLEEAVEYIRMVLAHHNVSLVDAEKLALCLGCFPLALAQAISYILTRNIGIHNYIELYDSKKLTRKRLLDIRPLAEDAHQETLWIAVSLSLERLEDLNTQNIIAALSYLAPEMPILGDFIESWTHETANNQKAIVAMRQYGLIAGDKEKRSVRIHQMVQEVIRLNHDESAKQIILDMLVSKLFSYLSKSTEPLEDEHRLLVMMAHALSVNSKLAEYECFNDVGIILKLACLEIRVVDAKRTLGQNQEALIRGLTALELLDSVPEFDQGYAAALACQIGLCYQGLGNAKDGLHYHLRAHKIYEAKYEDNEVIGALGLINIAACYISLGEIQKAHGILGSILPKLEKIPDLSIGALLINISTTFRELGDSEMAIHQLKRALDIQRKIYGPDHTKVAVTLNNLSAIYADLDQPILALALIEKSLEIHEARFGKDHLMVAGTLDIMGNVYCGAGRPQEAQNVLQRGLKIRVQQLGSQHPEVALTKFNLANAIMNLAEPEAAKTLLDEALLIQQQYYGGYSPEAGRTMHILGNAYHDHGNIDKAIESMTLAIKILERNFGASHRELAKVYNDISCVYMDRQSMQLAHESGEKALLIFEKTLGPVHVEVARTLNNLANMLRKEKQLHKALPLLHRALDIFEKQLGANHLDLAGPLINIGGIYLQLKEYSKAKEYFERALQLSLMGYHTTEHPRVAMIQLQLAKAETMAGYYELANEHSTAAYQFYNRTCGQNNIATQEANKLKCSVVQLMQSRPAPKPQVDFLDSILRSDQPLDLPTCVKLVERCLLLNQPIIALQFTSLVQDNTPDVVLKKLIVRCYLETGEIKSAMETIDFIKDVELVDEIKQTENQRKIILQKIQALDSNNQVTDRLIIQKAQLYLQLFQFDNAKVLLQSVVEKTPLSEHLGPALYQLAMCQYYQQEYRLAFESLTRSQKIHDHDRVRDLFVKISTANEVVPKLMQIAERSFMSASVGM